MLRRPFSHPLDIFIQDDSLFMMEAMLPFLDPQVMKPLAIYIKFTEMMIILNNINNQDYMRRCCFHKDINNYDAVLSSLKDMGMSEDIEQAMRMKSAMDMMQHMNNTHNPNKGEQYDARQHNDIRYEDDQYAGASYGDTAAENIPEENNYDSPPNEGGSVFDNIMDILNDYDREHPSSD